MATAVQGISERDWLLLMDDKGLEYIDGKLADRGMTTIQHDEFAWAICVYLHSKGFVGLINNLWRMADGNEFRPDVLVRTPESPKEKYLTHTPALVIEILSPSNPAGEMQSKFETYEKWGVPFSLRLDPEKEEWSRFVDGAFHPMTDLTFDFYQAQLDLSEIPKLIP